MSHSATFSCAWAAAEPTGPNSSSYSATGLMSGTSVLKGTIWHFGQIRKYCRDPFRFRNRQGYIGILGKVKFLNRKERCGNSVNAGICPANNVAGGFLL